MCQDPKHGAIGDARVTNKIHDPCRHLDSIRAPLSPTIRRPARADSGCVRSIGGEAPRFSAPRELFRQPIETFDVTPDGQRVYARRVADGGISQPLTVIANWTQLIPK